MNPDIAIDEIEYPTLTISITDRANPESIVALDGTRISVINAPQITQISAMIAFGTFTQSYQTMSPEAAIELRSKLLAGAPIAVECGAFISDACLCDSATLTFPPGSQDACTLECTFTAQISQFTEPQSSFGPIAIPSVPVDLQAVSGRSSNLFSSINKLTTGLQNLDALIPQLNAATFGRVRGMIKNCISAANSCLLLMAQLTPDRVLLNAISQTQRVVGALLDADSQAARLQQPPVPKLGTITITEPVRVSQIARETGNSITQLVGLNPGLKSPIRAGTTVRFIP
jgi:hypothetical protein